MGDFNAQLSLIDHKGLQLRDRDCQFWLIEADLVGGLLDLDLADVADALAGLQEENTIIKHDAAVVLFFNDADQIKAVLVGNFHDVLLGLLHRKKITVY